MPRDRVVGEALGGEQDSLAGSLRARFRGRVGMSGWVYQVPCRVVDRGGTQEDDRVGNLALEDGLLDWAGLPCAGTAMPESHVGAR